MNNKIIKLKDINSANGWLRICRAVDIGIRKLKVGKWRTCERCDFSGFCHYRVLYIERRYHVVQRDGIMFPASKTEEIKFFCSKMCKELWVLDNG